MIEKTGVIGGLDLLEKAENSREIMTVVVKRCEGHATITEQQAATQQDRTAAEHAGLGPNYNET